MNQPEHSIFTSDLLWTIGLFVLIFAVLKAFVLPRMADAINRRTRAIEEDVRRAREAREAGSQQPEEAPGHFSEQIDEADQEVQRMITESAERLRKQHDELMESCKEDIASRGAAFHEEAEAKRLQAMREIRAEAARNTHDGSDADSESPPLRH